MGIRRNVKLVWRSYLLDFLSDGFTEDSIFHLLCLRIDGLDGIDILTRIIGEFRTYGVKNIPIRTVIGSREIEGFHLISLAIHNHGLRLHIVIISAGIDAEILSSLRHFAIEIDAARIDGLDGFHRLSIHHLHGGFIRMILRESVASGICHIEFALIKTHTFRLPAHLASGNHLLGLYIYLSHIPLFKGQVAALVGVGCDVEIVAVSAHLPIVGHVLGSPASRSVGVNILDDVRPVHGDGNERIIHLDDVIGRISQFTAVHLSEPLVGEHTRRSIVIGKLPVIRLPVSLVADDEILADKRRRIYRLGIIRSILVGTGDKTER